MTPAKTSVGPAPALSAFYSGHSGNNLNVYVGGKPMAAEPDWANKLAWELENYSSQLGGYYPVEGSIATALRKAKADGMKLAAEHCGDPDYAPTADRWELANCFDAEADKINPPTVLKTKGKYGNEIHSNPNLRFQRQPYNGCGADAV